jgi:hypothetical protein
MAQAPGFSDVVRTAVPTNEQLVQQIHTALPMNDLVVLADQNELAVIGAEQLEQQLADALALAPDDATRSRLDGVLTHTRAALDALRLTPAEATVDSAHGRLDQALGEALEGLNELRPFAEGLPSSIEARPAALPTAGSLESLDLRFLSGLGLALVLVGFALRQRPTAA